MVLVAQQLFTALAGAGSSPVAGGGQARGQLGGAAVRTLDDAAGAEVAVAVLVTLAANLVKDKTRSL